MDLYMKKVLRVSVAQICQTIGYNAIQSIPLELLIDNLHKFLQEFARDLHRHVELFNRTEANLDDVAISLNNLNININDLLDYFYHVQPVGCVIEIPQLPAPKTSNLNFLKPGSKEVLTRPVHIYEHLPPILRDNDEIDEKSNVIVSSSPNSGATGSTVNYNNENVDEIVKSTGDQLTDSSDTCNPGIVGFDNPNNTKRKLTLDSTVISAISAVTSSATREISSVMMTSGGFISPAIEGRMPEFIIPDIVEKYFGMDSPPLISSTSVAVNSQTSAEKPLATSSLTSNVSYTSSLFHSSTKSEVSSASFSMHKTNQVVDRKQIKKVKKKPVNLITTTNIPTSSSILNDKAQRKRIKMLQKSMVKNSNNAFNGTFKVKNNNGNNVSHGSQDKYLKKQYKIKQKHIRHQHFQKKIEAFEAVPITNQNILASGKRVPGHIYLPTVETGDSVKQKKDEFAFSEHLENNQLTTLVESEASTAISTLTSYPSSKGIGHHSLSQDNRSDLTPAQLTHPTQDLSSSQCDEIKLNNEPDRNKLNIFKKISSSGRKDRLDLSAVATSTHSTAPPATVVASNADLASVSSSNTTIFGDDQVISLPSGTTITPAPPSGSGRHVYAPPPTSKPGDFDSIISVDDDPSIPESSAVLLQRGDLMIHKPKKRGRKPGSKNQPKLLGLTTKKAKKLKKSFFGHHSNANLLEPLNLSHSSIANIANIPLGIASTFPIDSESVLKFKKDRRKSKLGKDANSIRSSVKSPIGKNLVPTKEEFASINQKLMLMDTVLQTAPSSSAISTSLISKGIRTDSPSFGIVNSFSIDSNLNIKAKKEKKKVKQNKEDKQTLQQGIHSLLNATQPNKISPNLGCNKKSPLSYTSPNFPNVPGMGNLPMFPFYTLPARPGLIPSHSLFSQLPSMHSNPLFMPPLMGFRPLNPSVHTSFKPEKELTPPPLHIGEGNYSKVAPLVPDTMKLELSPAGYPTTSSPSAVKLKTSIITTVTSTKNELTPLSGQILTQESNITQSIPPTPGNSLQFNDLRKKFDDLNSPSSSTNNSNVFHNLDVTIEVSSDDSVQGVAQYKSPSLTNRIQPSALVSSSSTFSRQSALLNDLLPSNDDIGKSPDSSTDRINKEHKKNKKLSKQNKKQSNLAGTSVFENSGTLESSVGVSGDFDEEACVLKGFTAESGKKNDNPAHSSSYTSFELSMCTERRRDHKKMKKLLKEGKLKKKKDKKDKNKNKERSEKFLKNEKMEKRKEEKDKTKKLKKEKKKEKQRTDIETTKVKCSSSGEGTVSFLDTSSGVPKLTLKLGQSSQSPILPETNEVRKAGLKSSVTSFICTVGNKLGSSITSVPLREPSPELARISPLVTRPPKQKSAVDEPVPFPNLSVGNLGGVCNASGIGQHTTLHQIPSLSASLNIHVDSVIDVDSNSGGSVTSMLPASATILGHGTNTSSESPNNNLTLCNASTIVVPNESYQSNQHQMTNQHSSSIKPSAAVPLISETNRPSSYIDAEGNRVWICPACGKVDDGSAMIGCDGCDAWYHWVCVGIFVAPNDNEDWFCRVCIAKKRGMHAGDRKRKRSKKKA